MTHPQVSGLFLTGTAGPVFITRYGPPIASECLLVIPPFGEEMNKCRRMMFMIGSEMARRGWVTVLPDLYGTGDSGGDFVDADWDVWVDDLSRTADWCRSSGVPVTAVLAVRLGCLLACEQQFLASIPRVSKSVFWQPVLDGPRYLKQFFRLRIAASMANDVKESASELLAYLSRDGELEVAGYRLSANLASQIERVAKPAALPDKLGAVDWFEITRLTVGTTAKSTGQEDDVGRVATVPARHVLTGEPFWASTEIVLNEELVKRTCDAFSWRSAE